MKFGTKTRVDELYIPAKFRDSSSRISWFAHRRFLPPSAHPAVTALPYTRWAADETKKEGRRTTTLRCSES